MHPIFDSGLIKSMDILSVEDVEVNIFFIDFVNKIIVIDGVSVKSWMKFG